MKRLALAAALCCACAARERQIVPPSANDVLSATRDRFPAAARFLAPARSSVPAFRVRIPQSAADPALIVTPELALRLRPIDAPTALAEWSDGLAVHASPRTRLLRRVDANGLEDLLELDEPPKRFELRTELGADTPAGIRLVDGVLEVLDAEGVPRVRSVAPMAWDRSGRVFHGSLRLEGCAADQSGVGPWGRSIVPLSRCTVVHAIDLSNAVAPVLVDPAWTPTGSLVEATSYSAASVRIPAGPDAGRILLVGRKIETYGNTCQLFDPTSATWSATTCLSADVGWQYQMRALSDGTTVLATSAGLLLRDVTGAWTPVPIPVRVDAVMEVVKVGGAERVLFAGGSIAMSPVKSAELVDAVARTSVPTGPLSVSRLGAASTLLADGRVLAAGGRDTVSSVTAMTEVYDPAKGTWSSAGAMTTARARPIVFMIAGRAVVADTLRLTDSPNTIDEWDGTAWTALPVKLDAASDGWSAAALDDGSILFAGGFMPAPKLGADGFGGAAPPASANVTRLIVGSRTVVPMAPLLVPRNGHLVIALPGARALVAGGNATIDDEARPRGTKSVELYDPRLGGNCTTSAECESGIACVDGVCCSTATCAAGYTCAGTRSRGSCAKANGTACACDVECGSGHCTEGVCCESGCGSPCTTCAAPGAAGRCTLRWEGSPCGSGVNKSCGACDAVGVCHATAEATRCAPPEEGKPEDCFAICRKGVCTHPRWVAHCFTWSPDGGGTYWPGGTCEPTPALPDAGTPDVVDGADPPLTDSGTITFESGDDATTSEPPAANEEAVTAGCGCRTNAAGREGNALLLIGLGVLVHARRRGVGRVRRAEDSSRSPQAEASTDWSDREGARIERVSSIELCDRLLRPRPPQHRADADRHRQGCERDP
jgi:hypothetical protein